MSEVLIMSFEELMALINDGYGCFDVACPTCGPDRQSQGNRSRKVLRIWRDEPDFARFNCSRCGMKGSARRDGARTSVDPKQLARLQADALVRDDHCIDEQRRKAQWLWRQASPASGTPAEIYLTTRGIHTPPPATVRFLEAYNWHQPAMIAAFGFADEPEPGILTISDAAVVGVHLTLLKPDGSGKADIDINKKLIGRSLGSPLVLAPANDLLGFIVSEGIEDGLSGHEATGLGVWVAGSASRLPALADAIPPYADCVTVLVDDDDEGRRHARELAARLTTRGIQVDIVENRKMDIAA
jgi:Toprim domain